MNAYDLNDLTEVSVTKIETTGITQQDKAHKVRSFISSNPAISLKNVAEKFNLDWDLGEEWANGMARINLYTDCSMNEKIMDVRVIASEWFR